ncbi:11202_t:CDS:2 [Diversispora eburnea]|uniref:11202_t:CDS:1 n=1 Tax=Diversispora eburnea TaxID=1213867 RepID=A0A9N8WDT4_9GLOM|nr:11202_t:CDS:2 [Diversispora eburnea]
MYSKEWEGKVAIDKKGRSPDASHDSLIKIIHQIPRSRIFDPSISAFELYPKVRRRGKNPPRPMNSFMILTLVIRKISSFYVELGDGKACTRIAQMIRWGAERKDWDIFLNLQKEFKTIHAAMFPEYDYRPKGSIPSQETNFHVLSSENYGEMVLTQKKKSKTNHQHQRQQHRNSPYTLPVVQSIPASPQYSPIPPSPMPEYRLPNPSNLEISQNGFDWNQFIIPSDNITNISEEMFREIILSDQIFNPSVSLYFMRAYTGKTLG